MLEAKFCAANCSSRLWSLGLYVISISIVCGMSPASRSNRCKLSNCSQLCPWPLELKTAESLVPMDVISNLLGFFPVLCDWLSLFDKFWSPPRRLKRIRKSGRKVGMHVAIITVLISLLWFNIMLAGQICDITDKPLQRNRKWATYAFHTNNETVSPEESASVSSFFSISSGVLTSKVGSCAQHWKLWCFNNGTNCSTVTQILELEIVRG